MLEVGIIGAGELGGATAHLLARRDLARRVTLVDETGRVAEGKALDLAQAAPVEAFATQMSGTTDVAAIAGAQAIVFADAVKGGEWSGDVGLALLKRVAASAPRAVLVFAGAHGRELVERGVLELKIRRERMIGTAPEALASGVRALVALAVSGSPRDVSLAIVGAPPRHIVVAWDDATIAGFAATRRLDEPVRRAIGARAAALWPPGPHALAAAAVKALAALEGGRQIVTGFVGPDTSAGTRTRAAALPVRLDTSGIAEVLVPELSAAERVAFENAMAL
jgi:malate dehydrogenase